MHAWFETTEAQAGVQETDPGKDDVSCVAIKEEGNHEVDIPIGTL